MAQKKSATRSRKLQTSKHEIALSKLIDVRRKSKPPKAKRLGDAALFSMARQQLMAAGMKRLPRQFTSPASALPDLTPAVEITPRAPHNDLGHIDVYRPGRWDTSSNLIYLHAMIQTGPSPGEWDGSVVYAKCKAPTSGTYLVAAVFAPYSDPSVGLQVRLRLSGPWGIAISSGPTTAASAVTALWNGSEGETVNFSVTCADAAIGYLQSIRLYLLD
jgi:hypothetical protein